MQVVRSVVLRAVREQAIGRRQRAPARTFGGIVGATQNVTSRGGSAISQTALQAYPMWSRGAECD